MCKIIRSIFILIIFSPWLFPTPGHTAEYHLGMDVGVSINRHTAYLDRGELGLVDQLHFSEDRSSLLMRADPYCAFTLGEGIGGYLQADMNWENSDDETADESVEVELTNAYLQLSKGPVGADLGLQTLVMGNGRIMIDDVPAAALRISRGNRYMQLTLAQALGSSPLAAVSVGYRPGAFEDLALFGIWFKDQDDAFAKAIPLFYQVLLEPESDGDLYWTGISADLFAGKALLSATVAYQWGQFGIHNATARTTRQVSAFLADLSVEGNLTDWCSLGVFFYFASGDDAPLQDDLNAFVSIMPFNPRAAVFFDPEFLGRDEDDEKLTFGGGYYGGVMAPGLTLNLVSPTGLSLGATVATFFAHQALDDGSRWYGWEFDLDLSYPFGRFYTLYIEAARFQHGDYYESLLSEPVDAAVRLTAGLRASF